MREPLLIFAPFNTVAFMPIKQSSSIIAPCMTAPCPMETLFPILTG